MKVKTISRTEEDYCRKSTLDITKVFRNRDPALHPFERAREYTKALVATKLDKIFAKPFIGGILHLCVFFIFFFIKSLYIIALEGHSDGVYSLCTLRSASNLPLMSGACDGEVSIYIYYDILYLL